jgi:hypothetical protein
MVSQKLKPIPKPQRHRVFPAIAVVFLVVIPERDLLFHPETRGYPIHPAFCDG